MKNKVKRLNASSSMREAFWFLLSTYDGWLSASISVLYFIWGGALIAGIIPEGDVDPYGLISIAMAVLAVYVWHRMDSSSNDLVKSFYCAIGVLAIAAIPHYKLMERLF